MTVRVTINTGDERADVRDFRSVGTDSDAIDAAIAAAVAGQPTLIGPATAPRTVYFPAGTYRLDRPIVPAAAQIRFVGDGHGSVLLQTVPDTPIFRWNNDLSGGAHSIRFADLQLRFASAPTVATTQQYAIQYRPSPDGSAATGSGFYLCSYDRVWIENAYVGVGSYTTAGGACPIWANTFDRCVFRNTLHHAIDLGHGGGGQPSNTIRDCRVLNSGFGPGNDGAAIRSAGDVGLLIEQFNVEDWRDTVLDLSGGGGCVIANLRAERHEFTGRFPVMCVLADGAFTVNGGDVLYRLNDTTTAYPTLYRVQGDASLSLRGGRYVRDVAGSTVDVPALLYSGLLSTGSPTITSEGVKLDAHTSEHFDSGWGADTLYARVRVDGLPPIVDALPPASASYRGREFRVETPGSDDRTCRCVLRADGTTYQWVEI